MKQRIAHVAVLVREYDEAIQFYGSLPGFELKEDTDMGNGKRWVMVGPKDHNGVTLLLARATSPDQLNVVGNQAGGRVFLFLYTDNIDRDYILLKEHNIEIVREPVVQPYGTVTVFRDLYGNLWDLIQPS